MNQTTLCDPQAYLQYRLPGFDVRVNPPYDFTQEGRVQTYEIVAETDDTHGNSASLKAHFRAYSSGLEFLDLKTSGTRAGQKNAFRLIGAFHDAAAGAPGGLKKMRLAASKANGVSFWSRLGFYPAPLDSAYSWPKIQESLLGRLTERCGAFHKSNYIALNDILRSEDPRTLCLFSNSDIRTLSEPSMPVQEALGFKHNFRDVAFFGTLYVDDPHYTRYFLRHMGPYIEFPCAAP